MGILSFPLFMGEGFVAFAVTMALSFVAAAILTFLFGHTPEMDGDVGRRPPHELAREASGA